jgi:hypothetical protein
MSIDKKYKYNEDLLIIKHLIGKLNVSSKIMTEYELGPIKKNNYISYTEIQCPDCEIHITYKMNYNETPFINAIMISKNNNFMFFRRYNENDESDENDENNDHSHHISVNDKTMFVHKDKFIKIIKDIENDIYFKDSDKHFFQKYMIAVRYCFDLIGG